MSEVLLYVGAYDLLGVRYDPRAAEGTPSLQGNLHKRCYPLCLFTAGKQQPRRGIFEPRELEPLTTKQRRRSSGANRAAEMRDWYFISEQLAPAPHFAHPEGCASLRIVLVTVPRVAFPG